LTKTHLTSRPKSGVLNRWNHNADAQKQPAPKPFKPAKSKSPSDNVVIPKLNEAHVKMFTAQEAANSPKLQEALKKQPFAAQHQVKATPVVKSTPVTKPAPVRNEPLPKKSQNKFTPPQPSAPSAVKSPPTEQKRPAFLQNRVSEKELVKHPNPPVPEAKKSQSSVPVTKPTAPPSVVRVKASNGNALK